LSYVSQPAETYRLLFYREIRGESTLRDEPIR